MMSWGDLQGAKIVLLAPNTPAQVAGPSSAAEAHYVNCVTFNEGETFFFYPLVLEKFFDGKLRFDEDFQTVEV